jgi:hypothetical protein
MWKKDVDNVNMLRTWAGRKAEEEEGQRGPLVGNQNASICWQTDYIKAFPFQRGRRIAIKTTTN